MLLFYVLTLVSCFLSGSLSQPDFMHMWWYRDRGNYTTNSTYQRNLETLLSSSSQIPSKAVNNSGFYNLSVGLYPDQVNSLALCRGDASSDVCRSCLTNATNKIEQACPNSVEAIGVYDYCQLRYSNRTIYGVVEENPSFMTWSLQDASNVTAFNEALQKLLDRLRSAAVSSNNLPKFATGNETAGFFVTIYGMLQCSPDLSDLDCENCLTNSIAGIPGCCGSKNTTKISYRLIKPSCYMRYDTSRFYQITEYEMTGTAPSPTSSSPGQVPKSFSPPPLADSPPITSEKGNGGDKGKNVVVIIVPIVTSIVLVLAVCIFFFLSRQKQKPVEDVGNENELERVEIDSLRFDLATIKDATSNFSQENKLGEGGFGAVYKGTLRNGTEVAVKRLSKGSLQGELEFKNEVLLVAKLQHRNLVRLLGFCLDREERLLIYEFVVNSSLDHFIFDPEKRKLLDWTRRYKIIVGIVRGLQYLHVDSRLRIIHRDLKASNILLDAEMNPKISDFGLAKLFAIDQSEGNTSKIAGTYGYMAPEYAAYGQFSVKSDVFSFGVLLLEILSGRKNLNFQRGKNVEDLLSYTWKNWSKGTPMNVVDPTLSTGSDIEKMRCIHIGLLCVQENVVDRPDMASIALMLNSSSLSLARPARPAFFWSTITGSLEPRPFTPDHDSRVSSASKLNEEAVPLSRNEASITELSPR